VFLDESGTHVAMTPRYARAPRGERAYGRVPHNWGDNITLVATLTPTGPGPAMTLAGALDGPAFLVYVRELLAPALVPGQTVILDNLAVHKRAADRRLIEARGCRLLFLPPYSPDCNPIELAFAKLKTTLRRARATTWNAPPPPPWTPSPRWSRPTGSATAATRSRVSHYEYRPSTTATLILFFGAKTSTFAAYQTTIGGQEPSTNVKVSL